MISTIMKISYIFFVCNHCFIRDIQETNAVSLDNILHIFYIEEGDEFDTDSSDSNSIPLCIENESLRDTVINLGNLNSSKLIYPDIILSEPTKVMLVLILKYLIEDADHTDITIFSRNRSMNYVRYFIYKLYYSFKLFNDDFKDLMIEEKFFHGFFETKCFNLTDEEIIEYHVLYIKIIDKYLTLEIHDDSFFSSQLLLQTSICILHNLNYSINLNL